MKLSPTVSVVIPLYNGESVIEKTINSVLAQTFRSKEVIVVDDGSKDRSLDVIRTFGDTIRYVSTENGGVARARNIGLNLAVGKFIAFLDHDDLWDASKLERQVKILQEKPDVGMVVTDIIHIDSNDLPIGKYAHGFNDKDEFYRLFVKGFVPTPSSVMIRKIVFDQVGGFDSRFSQAGMDDHDLWTRIAEGWEIEVIPEGLTFHRQSLPKPNYVGLEHRMLMNQIMLERFAKDPKKKRFLLKEKASYLSDIGKQLIREGDVEAGRQNLRKSMVIFLNRKARFKTFFRGIHRYLRSYLVKK